MKEDYVEVKSQIPVSWLGDARPDGSGVSPAISRTLLGENVYRAALQKLARKQIYRPDGSVAHGGT